VGQSGLSVQLCVLNTYKQLGNALINLDLYGKLRRQGMKKVCDYWRRWKTYVTKQELKFQSERTFTFEYEETEEAATAILALTAVAVDQNVPVVTSPLLQPELASVESLAEPTVIVNTERQEGNSSTINVGDSGIGSNVASNLNQDENLQPLMALFGTKYYYMYIVDNVFDVIIKLGVMSFEISLNIIQALYGSDITQIASKLKEIAYKNTVKRYLTYYSAAIDPVIFPLKTIGTDKEKWIQDLVSRLLLILKT
jgi:hypothetical protein